MYFHIVLEAPCTQFTASYSSLPSKLPLAINLVRNHITESPLSKNVRASLFDLNMLCRDILAKLDTVITLRVCCL